jgi:hypothetical protein
MSALFSAYRTVGLTCGGAQQHVQTLGDETFLTTPIGKSFLVWRADHLSVAMASSPLPHTPAAAGGGVAAGSRVGGVGAVAVPRGYEGRPGGVSLAEPGMLPRLLELLPHRMAFPPQHVYGGGGSGGSGGSGGGGIML